MSNLFDKLFKSNQVKTTPNYMNWRNSIFSASSETVGIPSSMIDQVYGVVMDVGKGDKDGNPISENVVISQTAFPTGESSIRQSNGGGIIGLGGNDEIVEFAKQIITVAQVLFKGTIPVKNNKLPTSGKIYYYFLTISGIRFYESNLMEIKSSDDLFNQIFARFARIKKYGEDLWRKNKPQKST